MSSNLLTVLGALGGLAGLAAAIAILMRVGVDKTDVKIESAGKVMIGQSGFIDQLQEQLNQALLRITAIEEAQALVVRERDFLRNENVKLKRRVDHQDDEIAALKQRVSDLTRSGVAGPAGPTGEAGESGPQGEMGVAGPAGDVGHRGAQGEPGQTGQQGQAGEVGHRGQQGEHG